MLKTYITLIISVASTVAAATAHPITVNFNDTPLPTALKTIEQIAGDDITINFSLRKLEDYTVTTDLIDVTPLEAVSQAIGFYPIKVTCKGNVITVQPMLDTDYKLCGRLVDERGDGVDYATVKVLALPDSTLLTAGVSNQRGDFVIPVQTDAQVVLKASRIGYKTATVTAGAGKAGDIRLEADPHVLNGITAYADRKIISTAGAVTDIRVEGTPYSQMGTLADMLPNLPGLLLPQGANGANATLYYINGREVSETTQLNMLRADEIRSISIDKAPGAEYPADAGMVINISTVRRAGDYINLQLSNTSQLHHKLSDRPEVDFKLQLGKFTTALNLQYDYLKARTTESRYRHNSLLPSMWVMSSSDVDNRDKGPRLNWSGELQLNPRNRLGLYYYFYSLDNEMDRLGKSQTATFGVFHTGGSGHSQSTLHSGTASYDYTGTRVNLHVAQDVAYSNPYSYLRVLEYAGGENSSRMDTHDYEYFVTTSNARLGLNLGHQTLLSLGGRLSYIKSNSHKIFYNYDPLDSWVDLDYGYGALNRYNDMEVNETTTQGYLTLSQRVGKMLIVPGIRYEHTDRWISDNAVVEMPGADTPEVKPIDNVYDKSYGHWLPSLMMKYADGSFNTSLRYVSRMEQPTFGMLNSGLVYEDILTYYNSNSLLLPTRIDEVRLSGSYRGLTADVGYKNIRNSIAEIVVPMGSKGMAYRVPINLDDYHEWDVNVAYNNTFGRLGCYAAANVVIPGWNTVYYSSQKATFNAELNLTYALSRKLSLYTNFHLLGSKRWMVYDRLDSQLWNLGASASLLGNLLNINLEATDLLNRNQTRCLTTVYNGITNSNYVAPDSRGIRLRVAYTLFNKPIRTKVHRGNVDDIGRIEH